MKSPYLALGRRVKTFQEFVGEHEITEDKEEIFCEIYEILKKQEALLNNIENMLLRKRSKVCTNKRNG